MTSQPEASRRHREIDGRGFGSQSFAILPKIHEWDNLLQTDHQARALVREIHPEMSFSALNGGRGKGLAYSKKTQDGAARRTDLLRSCHLAQVQRNADPVEPEDNGQYEQLLDQSVGKPAGEYR